METKMAGTTQKVALFDLPQETAQVREERETRKS